MEAERADRAPAVRATFEIAPCVAEFVVSPSEYLRLNPSISALIVGAALLCGDYILLIQRASNDFAPLMREVPGGACEPGKDATILDAVARELWEETGLHLRSVKRHVDHVEFDDGRQSSFTWRKITFEVDVTEGHGRAQAESKEAISAAVRLNPAEHQDWRWARRADVGEGKGGKGRLQSMDLQRGTILAAFDAAEGRGGP